MERCPIELNVTVARAMGEREGVKGKNVGVQGCLEGYFGFIEVVYPVCQSRKQRAKVERELMIES